MKDIRYEMPSEEEMLKDNLYYKAIFNKDGSIKHFKIGKEFECETIKKIKEKNMIQFLEDPYKKKEDQYKKIDKKIKKFQYKIKKLELKKIKIELK
ncbi:hypothetical protein M0Q97_11305 [Candidatus Dojkabacteria bacterium]|jgi:hypothetical protein|nr:hypothetical protein [Candidatus Dojkabacteria bacterium]